MYTTNEWDHRFSQQALWTQSLRQYLYKRTGMNQLNHIIEIGCGTGAILADFKDEYNYIYGLDLSETFIHHVFQKIAPVHLSVGDAHALPFDECSFDIVLCHFFLLWVSEPLLVLQEMKRISRNNGSILLLAEPDYSGRIDYPDELKNLGIAQNESLIKQGADPYIGRRLGSLFHTTGIKLMEMGIMGGQWRAQQIRDLKDEEWQVLTKDIKYLNRQGNGLNIEQIDMNYLQKVHHDAANTGERVLFVPTFYAWGKVFK